MFSLLRARRLTGFTLVELLVVILVLGVLLAIALPALLNAQDSAKQAQAKTDLNSSYKAAKLYAASNEGSFSGFGGDNNGLAPASDGGSTVTSAGGGDLVLTKSSTDGSQTCTLTVTDRSAPAYTCGATASLGYPANLDVIMLDVSDVYGTHLGFGSVAADGANADFAPDASSRGTMSYNGGLVTSADAVTDTVTWSRPDGSNAHTVNVETTMGCDFPVNPVPAPDAGSIKVYCGAIGSSRIINTTAETYTSADNEGASVCAGTQGRWNFALTRCIADNGVSLSSYSTTNDADETVLASSGSWPFPLWAVWSPDGTKVAFWRWDPSLGGECCQARLWTVDSDGSNLTATDIIGGTTYGVGVGGVFSPDGASFAYAGMDGVYVAPLDGSAAPTRIVEYPSGVLATPVAWPSADATYAGF